MNLKQIFKMIESANTTLDMLGEKTYRVQVQFDIWDYQNFQTFAEFKKYCINFMTREISKDILNVEFTQDSKYKNYFNHTNYTVCIIEN